MFTHPGCSTNVTCKINFSMPFRRHMHFYTKQSRGIGYIVHRIVHSPPISNRRINNYFMTRIPQQHILSCGSYCFFFKKIKIKIKIKKQLTFITILQTAPARFDYPILSINFHPVQILDEILYCNSRSASSLSFRPPTYYSRDLKLKSTLPWPFPISWVVRPGENPVLQ